jgi:RsiW-degrading membrane proteinase PrsW (M82 family)
MTSPESAPQAASPADEKWVFNAPPGWPEPSAGWQPPPGWQPDPSWPTAPAGWEFWKPAPSDRQDRDAASATANELHLTVDGRSHVFQPGQPVRIGRSPDNEVVVGDPAVSRQHARLTWGPDGWIFENTGQAPTFLRGQQVTRVEVTQPLDLALGSDQGTILRIESPSAPNPQAAAAPQGSFGQGDPDFGRPPIRSNDELGKALQILFPVKSWLDTSAWRQGLRLLVIVYAMLPLVFLALFASSGNLTTPGWAYGLYIAPLWAIGFWLLIRPGHIRRLEIQVGIGIIVWTLAWINIVTININGHLHPPLSLPAAIGVGLNEEITKALPILIAGLILLKYRKVKLDVRMWMFLGTIAGLTFGVFEQAFYTSSDIVIIHQAQDANQAVQAVLSFAERVFVDGFQHAVWAGISAFFIGMAVNYGRRRIQLVVLGLAVPAVLHALNDWCAGAFNSLWPSIIVQAISLLLFLGYTMSAASIERQVSETPLFRGDSMMMKILPEARKGSKF